MERLCWHVVGAGQESANGTYTFTNKFVDEKPVFKNSAGLFLSFRHMWSMSGGWGIREASDDDTLYHVKVESVLPPVHGWVVFEWGKAPLPAPTLEIGIQSTDRETHLKRNVEHVVTMQEQSWKHRKFSDAEIVCAGVRTSAHRGTLSAASRVFDAAFSSTMAEGQSGIYEIKDATPTAVEAMLHHIYTGVLHCQSDELPTLFMLAMRYELDVLGTDVATQMLQCVNAENVRNRLAVLKLHSTKHVAQSAMTRIINMIKAEKGNELVSALV